MCSVQDEILRILGFAGRVVTVATIRLCLESMKATINKREINGLCSNTTLLCVCAHSVVSDSFVTPWTVARQAPLSMGFPWQEYERGLPFPPPGDFHNPGIEPTCPVSPALAGGFFTT